MWLKDETDAIVRVSSCNFCDLNVNSGYFSAKNEINRNESCN